MTAFPAPTLIDLQEQLRAAATALGRVVNELTAYVPKAFPTEPLSDVVVLVSDHDSSRFLSALSQCASVVDAARKAFEQDGGGREA
jgi:hypothetical protein